MYPRRLRLTPIVWGCLAAGTWSWAYGDPPTAILPAHWFISGQEPAQAIKEYAGAIDRTNAYDGSGSGLLQSISDAAHSGTLMQVSSAAAYRGKRLRMTAFSRSSEVAQRAGLWIRADNINGTTVAFRNCLSSRAPRSFVQGDTPWKEVETFIDVPDSAVALSYGVQMIGTGAVWIDDVDIEVVGSDSPAHVGQVNPARHPPPNPQKLSAVPLNLNFES
jgi:hypothetical protein